MSFFLAIVNKLFCIAMYIELIHALYKIPSLRDRIPRFDPSAVYQSAMGKLLNLNLKVQGKLGKARFETAPSVRVWLNGDGSGHATSLDSSARFTWSIQADQFYLCSTRMCCQKWTVRGTDPPLDMTLEDQDREDDRCPKESYVVPTSAPVQLVTDTLLEGDSTRNHVETYSDSRNDGLVFAVRYPEPTHGLRQLLRIKYQSGIAVLKTESRSHTMASSDRSLYWKYNQPNELLLFEGENPSCYEGFILNPTAKGYMLIRSRPPLLHCKRILYRDTVLLERMRKPSHLYH